MRPLKRLQSAWHRHSPGEFLILIHRNIVHHLKARLSKPLSPGSERERSQIDLDYGIDTDEIREIVSLEIESENARHAVRYQPSPQDLATSLIRALPIDHGRFAFLDFGSGKGRVLLIAAQFPFAAVIGIEFSRELCSIANRNLERLPVDKRQASVVECRCEDVIAYALPETPLVCYFYNPFDPVIMKSVVSKLESSLEDAPRDVYVIYVHPEHRSLFESTGHWLVVDEGSSHAVFRARLASFR